MTEGATTAWVVRPAQKHAKARSRPVGTFGDAMAEAAAIVDELGRAFVAYTRDADFHRIEDVVLLVPAGEAPAPGTGVLLLSVDRDGDVTAFEEQDELRWGSFRRIFANRGYHLWDWIQADAESFRSMYRLRRGGTAVPQSAPDRFWVG